MNGIGINGIGGFFFKAADPQRLKAWYAEILGLDLESEADMPIWPQQGGITVMAPFDAASDYFGRSEQQWMLNFRVDDLDAAIAALGERGIAVETRAEWDSEVGRFARIHDPEGNPIELWEPAGPAV